MIARNKCIAIISGLCLSLVLACSHDQSNVGEPCFTRESLETVPWIIDELKQFKVPKSGGYHASVRIYKGEQFLVIGNGFVSSPGAYIYDCNGTGIAALGIGYNEFSQNSKLAAVLADVKY